MYYGQQETNDKILTDHFFLEKWTGYDLTHSEFIVNYNCNQSLILPYSFYQLQIYITILNFSNVCYPPPRLLYICFKGKWIHSFVKKPNNVGNTL
jgi:hypothetical protein